MRTVVLATVLYALLVVVLNPIATIPGSEIPGITPFFVGTIILADITTSFLLFVRFHEARTWPLILLASAYLYSGLMAVVHLLTFSGALLAQRPVLGAPPASTAWAFVLWIGGSAGLTCAAMLVALVSGDRPLPTGRSGVAIALAIGLTSASVLACAILAIQFPGRLPPLMDQLQWTSLNVAINWGIFAALCCTMLAAMHLSSRHGDLYGWLCIAVAAMMAANVLALAGGGRYTIGWIAARVCWTASAITLLLFFLGQYARQHRILARTNRSLEEAVGDRTAHLQQALAQRDSLLREVYHRVKNNLQVVDSLIALQARGTQDGHSRDMLSALRNRVHALGLAHQQLMSSIDLQAFPVGPFLRSLTDDLAAVLNDGRCRITTSSDDIDVDLDLAIPLGLVLTELVSYATSGLESAASLSVGFHHVGDGMADLAVTMPEPASEAGHRPGTIALDLNSPMVAGLIRQMDGRIVPHRGTNAGMTIRVPLTRAA